MSDERTRKAGAEVARGASWTIAFGIAARVVGLVGSVVITHLLHPSEAGAANGAFILVATAHFFSTLGVGPFLVTQKEERREVTFHVTVFYLAAGLVGLAIASTLRGHFAVSWESPALPTYFAGMALAIVLDRVAFVPERLLIREKRFPRLATTRAGSELVYSALSIGLAWAGFGGMALVGANVARSGLRCAVYVASVSPSRWLTPSRLSVSTFRRIFGQSSMLAVSQYAAFAASRWDNLIVGSLYGPAVMGQYNAAYNLADAPADQIGEHAAEALLPSLSSMRREERKPMALFSTGFLAMLVFPVSIGLGTVAPTLGRSLLGKDWSAAGGMIAVLCVLSIARPLTWQAGAYMMANGQGRALALTELFKLAVLFAAMLTVGRLGPLFACAASGGAFVVHMVVAQAVLAKTEGIRAREWASRIVPPALACVPMVLAILAVRRGLAALALEVRGLDLAVEVATGAVAYTLGALVLARAHVDDLVRTLKESRRR